MEVAGTRVQLPSGLDGPFEIYVNGVRRQAGTHFTRSGDELLFAEELKREGHLGFWRWTSLFLGVAGTYRQNDTVDVVYDVDGRRTVETGLPILEEQPIRAEER